MHWFILFLSFLLFFSLQIYNYFFISSAPPHPWTPHPVFFILYHLVYNSHLRNTCYSEPTYDWVLQMDESQNLRQVDLKLRVQANWLAENWCTVSSSDYLSLCSSIPWVKMTVLLLLDQMALTNWLKLSVSQFPHLQIRGFVRFKQVNTCKVLKIHLISSEILILPFIIVVI